MENFLWTKDEIEGKIDYNHNVEDFVKNNTWHNLFASTKWILSNPAEEIYDFYKEYMANPSRQILNRTVSNVQKIHDLGCGGGRHTYFFSELGYDVTGSDLSTNAIEYTEQELVRRNLKARLVKCPMTELPFEDGEFDVTISRAVINHSTLQEMKRVIFEVARTTKKGGIFMVTVSSDRASDFRRGTEVVKDLSYIPASGPEEGLIHTFFTGANAAALLEPFFIIDKVFLAEHPSLITADGCTDPDEYFGSEYVIIGIRR
ncbi:class I SAM-dependent methyltransferase [[Clostridium] polysaccharolyticum]|uniref:Methyltransferase domain-containing protein n=1 Tax=[Clostridium] polysaccharolyticum TaxID=29364 RepID=A0A1I0G3Q8_9FIRM|nr:class I SAM-dependent methyltransferase [[Clostridium] polysaccharolyticum]SET64672.1 Methyltransferase domain-containing protein [[Clostridium] polysaccharolyticum]